MSKETSENFNYEFISKLRPLIGEECSGNRFEYYPKRSRNQTLLVQLPRPETRKSGAIVGKLSSNVLKI